MKRTEQIFVTCWLVIAVAGLSSQQSFEVASVQESKPPGGGWTLNPLPPGQVAFTSVPLGTILTVAFDVPLSLEPFKFVGGSPAILGTLFTIHAKGDPAQDSRATLRTLLAERFGLGTHTEVRNVPIMALTRRDVLGPGLKPSPYNCPELLRKEVAEGRRLDLATEHCRPRIRRSPRFPLHWSGAIADLVAQAQPFIEQRPIVDMTGLQGHFEWDVAFVPIGATKSSDVHSILSAFEDELGLKFESRIGPYEVIVIDDVRMPTPN